MKFTSTARQLRDAMRLVRSVVERRNTYPLLGCVLFDGSTLRATNLDQEIAVRVAASEAKGKACVDAYRLAAIVDLVAPDEIISITAGKDDATLAFSSGRYELPMLPAAGFPELKFDGAAEAIDLAESGFGKALRFCAPAISHEETRYYLNGVCISRDLDDKPVLVATDGHRMCVHPVGVSREHLRNAIIPRDAVRVLLSMPDPQQIIPAGQAKIRFVWGGVTLTTKLIEGTFPDWQRVIPKVDELTPAITLDRAKLDGAIRRISAAHGKGVTCVSLVFSADAAALASKMPEASAREYLGGVATTNADGSKALSFNGRYMREMLRLFAAHDTVRLLIKDEGHAFRLTAAGNDAFAILMPMRGSDDTFAAETLREFTGAEPGRRAA